MKAALVRWGGRTTPRRVMARQWTQTWAIGTSVQHAWRRWVWQAFTWAEWDDDVEES